MQLVKSLRSPQLSTFLFALVLLLPCPAALIAQSSEESSPSADTVKIRIERARALVAAHQLETAASELESVRSATKDSSVHSITSIMLMNIYLEAGNYGRAEALLEENFREQSGSKWRIVFRPRWTGSKRSPHTPGPLSWTWNQYFRSEPSW